MHLKGFEPLRIAPTRPERATLTTRSQMPNSNSLKNAPLNTRNIKNQLENII